jgi:phage tail sheath protein FI
VHKAPANEVVRGAITLELNITKSEHDLLNPVGINVIRTFPGRGIRVWGARTLSSDPAWRYINVRRLFNYVSASILKGTQWAVFEPNDEFLWGQLQVSVGNFLLGVWRGGALFGATPSEAFFVKCDSQTNPQDLIDSGQVNVQIGIAPVKPAEFVIFQISQYTAPPS